MTNPVTPYPKHSCAAGRLPCGAAAGNPGRSSSSLNPGPDASPFPALVPYSCVPGSLLPVSSQPHSLQERFHASDRRLSSVLPTMASWFRRLLYKPKPRSVESSLNASRSVSSLPSSSSSSAESSGSSPSTSLARSVRSSPLLDISASGSARWAKSYDVCICHSEVDLELVEELVSYLEGQPESFRCFLQLRDAAPGSAVVTELCDAVQNSHCWVMLITPGFLRDPWCKYQMHQALAEAPMANGRTIPVLKDVDRKDYPKELRNLYYIYMALKENSFRQIRDTIMRYLQELCRSSAGRTE